MCEMVKKLKSFTYFFIFPVREVSVNEEYQLYPFLFLLPVVLNITKEVKRSAVLHNGCLMLHVRKCYTKIKKELFFLNGHQLEGV